MFGKLFGGKPAAAHEEDHVWASAAARRKGLHAAIEQRLAQSRSVMLVCLTEKTFDTWAETLAAHDPAHCRDLFGRKSLGTQLARPGSLTLALASSLPGEAAPATAPVDVFVHERHAERAFDDAIVRYADLLGRHASITFHLSMDDALLAPFVGSGKPLLERLGMTEGEAMSHAMITRAIANCQKQ